MKELDGMVRRMGAIAAVFDVRSSTVGNQKFAAFREVMDVYIDASRRNLSRGHDFVEGGVKLNQQDMDRLNAAFERVFDANLQGLAPSDDGDGS
jgi:hypothetical protein